MKTLIFLLLIVSGFTGFSQNATVRNFRKLSKEQYNEARRNITEMEQNSVLLVRIHSKTKQIAYYEKYGNLKAASNLKKKTDKRNLRLINAFRSNFRFCKVYFFEDTFSTYILENRFSEIRFYSDSLTVDTAIHLYNSKFYIAEYGRTEDNKEGYRSENRIVVSDSGTEQRTQQYGDYKLNVTAIIIRDNRFNQLFEPFPYYVKMFNGIYNRNYFNKKVYLLDENLFYFNKIVNESPDNSTETTG